MDGTDFDLTALYLALDQQRRDRGLTWTAVAREISRTETLGPVATSTITGVKDGRVAEGDGVLQMLLWLGRTPESFIPGIPNAGADPYRLPVTARGEILRWNARALHAAMDARRRERDLSWAEVAREIGGHSPGMLTNLAKGPRVAFPGVMRVVRWLGEPAAAFTHPVINRRAGTAPP